MQEIRPSSEGDHSSNYCSPDQSTFCNSATESTTTNNNNEGNTDHFTARRSSTQEKADDHHTIAAKRTDDAACGSSTDRSAEARRIIAANSRRTGYTATSSSTDYTIINYRSHTGIINCEAIRISGSQHQPDTRRTKAATKGKPIATN
jgi:hypothetical protein